VPGGPASRIRVEPPRREVRVARSGQGRANPRPRPRRPRRAHARGSLNRQSNCPHCVPQRTVRRREHFVPARAPVRCDIRPPRGGYQPPITPGGGYRLRRTPECLVVMVAIGQKPTDSISAPRRKRREDLWGPAPNPRSNLTRKGPVQRARKTLDRKPPPEPEPAGASKTRALPLPPATPYPRGPSAQVRWSAGDELSP